MGNKHTTITTVTNVHTAINEVNPVKIQDTDIRSTDKTFRIKNISTEELRQKLHESGVFEDMNILFFVDKTQSNNWTGKFVFNGKCLHDITYSTTPYEYVLSIFGGVMIKDSDGICQMYDFGSKSAGKLNMKIDYKGVCRSAKDLVTMYRNNIHITRNEEGMMTDNDLYGPTSFTPVINEAIRVYNNTGKYHAVVILTDGSPHKSCMFEDFVSFNKASRYPLSFIIIGVGDGELTGKDPTNKADYSFHYFNGLDDGNITNMGLHDHDVGKASEMLRSGALRMDLDNIQFVDLARDVKWGTEIASDEKDNLFNSVLMEVPAQYKYFCTHGYTPNMNIYKFPIDDINNDRACVGLPPIVDVFNSHNEVVANQQAYPEVVQNRQAYPSVHNIPYAEKMQ